MAHKSVVVNYKNFDIFVTEETPDAGYLQFTRSAGFVYITKNGKDIGVVPVAEFDRLKMLFG